MGRGRRAGLPRCHRTRGLGEIVDFFVQNGPLVKAVIDASTSDELIEKAYVEFLATYERLITRGFDGLIERGELPPATPWLWLRRST